MSRSSVFNNVYRFLAKYGIELKTYIKVLSSKDQDIKLEGIFLGIKTIKKWKLVVAFRRFDIGLFLPAESHGAFQF